MSTKYKIYGVVFLLVVLFGNTYAQVNQRLVNNKTDEEILYGICTKDAFTQKPFYDWYNREYKSYKYLINRRLMDTISGNLKGYEIKVVLGTWCSDSRAQVPRFIGIMDYIEFDYANIEFICVDQNKSAGNISTSDLEIIKVPTFIFYKEGEEQGRIIETPTKTLEEDILKILFNPQPN
jgi:hypothetical protein